MMVKADVTMILTLICLHNYRYLHKQLPPILLSFQTNTVATCCDVSICHLNCTVMASNISYINTVVFFVILVSFVVLGLNIIST